MTRTRKRVEGRRTKQEEELREEAGERGEDEEDKEKIRFQQDYCSYRVYT